MPVPDAIFINSDALVIGIVNYNIVPYMPGGFGIFEIQPPFIWSADRYSCICIIIVYIAFCHIESLGLLLELNLPHIEPAQ